MGDLSALGSRAIIGRFYHKLSELSGQTWIPKVAMYFNSDQSSESYKWLGQVPQMREWVGGRLAKSLRTEGVTIENITYESTLEINVDDKRRDKTGQINVRIDDQARRVVSHWKKILTACIDDGASGSVYGNAYDATTFFSTSHAWGSSGTWRNALTYDLVSQLEVSTITAPTPEEYALAIFGVIGYLMQNVKDDQGELFNEDATGWLVMCPNVQQWTPCAQAVRNKQIMDSSGNALGNPLAAAGSDLKIEVAFNPSLTTFNGFYLFRTDADLKPFIQQEELGVQMAAIAEGSELEFENNVHHYGVKAIRNIGYGLPELAAKCTFH